MSRPKAAPAKQPRDPAAVQSRVGQTASRETELGPLSGYIGYVLRRAQVQATAGFLEAMREVDLRPTQFSVLILIHWNPGIRQTEVCEALGLQKANFVPLLNELERRGLAVRKPGVPDRRASALHLTDAGEGLLKRANELHKSWEAHFLGELDPREREQLLALLGKLR